MDAFRRPCGETAAPAANLVAKAVAGEELVDAGAGELDERVGLRAVGHEQVGVLGGAEVAVGDHREAAEMTALIDQRPVGE